MVRDPMQGEAPIRLPSRDEAPTQAETPAALAHSPIPVLGGATKKDPRNPRATRALEPGGPLSCLVVVSVATTTAPRHPPARPIRVIALTGTLDGRSLTEPVDATITPHRHDKDPFQTSVSSARCAPSPAGTS